jgi:hypothetical protein
MTNPELHTDLVKRIDVNFFNAVKVYHVGDDLSPLFHPAMSTQLICTETLLWTAGHWTFPASSRLRAGIAFVIVQRYRGLCPIAPCGRSSLYNRASEHPSVYVVEEKRLC